MTDINAILNVIKKEVHDKPHFYYYDATHVREATNCYSHALGATYPYLGIYRIGAISGKKELSENYTSIEEITKLFFEDLNSLELKYEFEFKTNSELFQLEDNQHIIKLYVKIYANGMIGDYHFLRYDEGVWTEKWRGQRERVLETGEYYDTDWMYHHVLTLRITK